MKTYRVALFALVILVATLACVSSPATTAPSYDETIKAGITVSECAIGNNYTTISGSLRNNTSVTLSFVKLKVFLENNGVVVDTDSTYAVGSEGLAPGETTQWEWMFGPNPPKSDKCGASLLDYRVK